MGGKLKTREGRRVEGEGRLAGKVPSRCNFKSKKRDKKGVIARKGKNIDDVRKKRDGKIRSEATSSNK